MKSTQFVPLFSNVVTTKKNKDNEPNKSVVVANNAEKQIVDEFDADTKNFVEKIQNQIKKKENKNKKKKEKENQNKKKEKKENQNKKKENQNKKKENQNKKKENQNKKKEKNKKSQSNKKNQLSVGLPNYGIDCFLNCCIQILNLDPVLKSRIFEMARHQSVAKILDKFFLFLATGTPCKIFLRQKLFFSYFETIL